MACLLLGRKEFKFLIAVLAAALLLLVAKANSQCPQGLPLFGDREPNSPLPNKIQAILPTYTFTCSGPVVQWGACVQPRDVERYDIYFQVWRLTGDDGCYSIVGSNFVDNRDPDIPRGCIVFDVPEEQRIMVEAGDVMGFYSDRVDRNNGGIEVDTAVNLDVWYRTLSNNPTQSDLEDSPLCIGSPGDLNTQFPTSGAPVVTAMVDNSQCLLSAPLFGDRDGVPRLPNSIQAIIPEYTFTCRGSVVQWGACVNPRGDNDRYDIYFEVWRPTGTDGCYSLIGSNVVTNAVAGNIHNVRACIVIDVPDNELVTVQPGDVVGFYADRVNGNGNGGVELDEGTQYENLEVWYRSNPSQSDLETNSLCVGVGEDLDIPRTGGAPVITAVIAADCGSLANPANGSVALTMTTFGSMASYSCSERNNLLGDAVRTCQADGMWSDSAPVCEEVCDGLTNPMNGDIMFSNGTFVGSVATYSCTMGFESVGSETRTCQSGSGWSGMEPSCERMCDPLGDPVNGQVMLTTRTQGSVASYSCETGYNLTGNNSRVCQMATDELEWSDGDPICQIVDCNSLANPGNGTVSATTTTFGSVASYSCSGLRYLLVGNATRMCQANGEWSGGVPTCEEVCNALTNPMNGDIMFSNGTFVGSVATYSCTMGFESVGSETRTCQSGSGWSGMDPSCERMCDPLDDPVNGQVILTTRTQDSVASYSCETGYNLTGSSSRVCQMATDELEWSDGDPICQIVNCSNLSSPANGTILLDTTSFGSTVTYSCNNSDHQLVGDAMRTCQANGMWTGSAPTCDLPSSQEQSQSQGGIVGGVVAGVLVAIALVVLVALAILYKKRKGSFALHSKVKSRDRTDTQQFGYELDNPLYSGVSTQPKVSSLTDKKETVYENPDHQRVDNNYVDPEKMDIYRTMSNVPLTERGQGTLLDTNGHYEWSIYVPTQEERRAVTSSTEWHENIYAALGEVQKPQDSFFEVSNIYWSPSSDPDELYDQLSRNKYREIPREHIQITEHLGSGQFGSVDKGIWQSITGVVEIAVKTLKAGTSQDDEVRFLQEAAINGQFQHPNIVKLLGVVTVGQPVMIVLELLPNGDLRNYLIRQQPAPGELLPSDTPHMLLQFCQEVASGMEYLSQKAFVHRDLAARNILVAADRTCKISDFGMSRDLENETYYVSHGGKIPVKWTAPEALHFKKYSTASDVWSYGALVYEIWSVGRKPFQSYTNQQAMKLVDSGVRLPPPPGCPKEIYKVMIRCWHPDKSSRPSFTEVVEALSEPEIDLLCWSEEDTAVHPQAAVLGAPLEAGVNLYPELQGTYT